MQARQTGRRSAGLGRALERPSSDGRPAPRQDQGTPERRPAERTAMPAEAVAFHSILLPPGAEGLCKESADEPEFFRDLNLDKVVAAVTAGKDDYDLRPFLYSPIRDLATIEYRHDIMKDLEHHDIMPLVRSFAQGMVSVRQHLEQSAKLHYAYQKKLWLLDAVDTYCAALKAFARDLRAANLRSQGLAAFRRYLVGHTDSEGFTALAAETEKLRADLSTIAYSMLIKGDKVTVQKYEATNDYSTVVQSTFARFKQGAVKDHLAKFSDGLDMNHVEASVLGFVAKLYPEIFSHLDHYVERNEHFIDPTIGRFDREIQFYLSYLEHISVLQDHGLRFCYPEVSNSNRNVRSRDGFDLALAHQLTAGKAAVVCNDFCLAGSERILVVSGPNQGGKTTFARTFGQLHYLASLGYPVPGTQAELFLFDRLLTHFERAENITTLRGKLEDDLVRIRHNLDQASPSSIIIMNEIFNSTTLRDAVFLGRKVLGRIMELDALAVCVTFIDELASLGDKTVSMVSTVVPENPAVRTFKIVRRPADGLAYALSIAAKYRLTYARMRERIRS